MGVSLCVFVNVQWSMSKLHSDLICWKNSVENSHTHLLHSCLDTQVKALEKRVHLQAFGVPERGAPRLGEEEERGLLVGVVRVMAENELDFVLVLFSFGVRPLVRVQEAQHAVVTSRDGACDEVFPPDLADKDQ